VKDEERLAYLRLFANGCAAYRDLKSRVELGILETYENITNAKLPILIILDLFQ